MKLGLGQIIFFIMVLFGVVTIVPALLNAKNDLAVLLGVIVVVAIFYGVIKYGKKILSLVGFDIN